MTDHDQLLKNLLEEFFGDLLRIVAPEIASKLKVDAPTFLREELFTSFPEGKKLFAHRFLDFSYLAFGLSRSQAEDYVRRSEPLAWGLASLMRRGWISPARHKLACLEPIVDAELTDRQRYLLVNCVETYVKWNEAAQEEYENILAEEGKEKVVIMETTWADRLRQEGRREGRREGEDEGKRDMLLALLERRFGPLPAATRKRVLGITSSSELSRLATRVLDAPSIEDLGL